MRSNRCLTVHGRFTLFLDEEEHLTADAAVQLLEVLLDFSPPELHLSSARGTVPQKLAMRLRLRPDCGAITARDPGVQER